VRRAVSFGVAWAVAAVVATFVAWQGVALVGEQVTDTRPAPLGPSAVAAPGVTTTTAPAVTSTSSIPTPSTPTTASTLPAQVGPPPPASGAPTGTAPGSGTSPPAIPAAETRSYPLVGGDASLQFAPSGVTVLFATPRPGFTVEVSNSHGNGVRVRFESDDHRSEVEGWWDSGPQDEVREEPQG
jgi:hypothetical protein